MKMNKILIGLVLIATISTSFNCGQQAQEETAGDTAAVGEAVAVAGGEALGEESAKEPWSPQQLMDPSVLAEKLGETGEHPVVINLGPSGVIAEAIDIGPGQEAANIARLKTELTKISKDREVVVYCGCCPFKDCPNIRPAFSTLKEAGFERPFLLNLKENLKVDWISKGYPMAKSS